jgi:PAS domain S-box-containing protein
MNMESTNQPSEELTADLENGAANPTIDALARGRQAMLVRANQIIGTDAHTALIEREHETVPSLAALLMSSLEELKVAEEELREQNALLSERRLAEEQRLQHYRLLFMHIPAPAFVTDLYATILDANNAAAALFRREARHLERKPLAALLDPASRDEFRKQLGHVVSNRDTRSCRLVFHRVGNLPLEARATVSIVPDLGPTGSGVLFWLIDGPSAAA